MEGDLILLLLWMCEGAGNLLMAGLAACAVCGYQLSSNMGLGALGLGTAMAGAAAGGHWNPYHYTDPSRKPPSVDVDPWWSFHHDGARYHPGWSVPPSGVPYDEWRQEWHRYLKYHDPDDGEDVLINPWSQNM